MTHQISGLRLIALVTILALLIIGCGKDEFSTKPKLEFLQAGSYDVSQGDYLQFNLKVTDKEGDISDSIFIRAFTRRCPNSGLTIPYQMPQVPQKSNMEAEIDIQYLVGVIDPSAPIWNLNLCPGVDTAIFQFWIKDVAGNRSDTVETDQPVLIRNN